MAAYSIAITFRWSCASVLSIALLVSCSNKPPTNHNLATCPIEPPLEPVKLLEFVSRLRHSDLACALAAAQPKTSMPPGWVWRFGLLHTDLLLDQGYDEAIASTVSKLVSSPPPTDVGQGEAAVRLASLEGYLAQRKQKWETAAHFYDEAIAGRSAVRDDPCWQAELLVQHQAQTLRQLRKFSLIGDLLTQAIPETASCPDKSWEIPVPFVEANCYNDQFLYENAVSSFQKCLTLARTNKLPQLIGNSLGNMALGYYNLGDTGNALAKFDETDDYYKSRRDQLNRREQQDWGRHRGRRARTYLLLKKYDDAERAYKEAIDIATKTSDTDYLTRWRDELTSLYIERGDYESARKLNQQVLKEVAENDLPVVAAARLNAARLARVEGDLPRAQRELDTLQSLVRNKYPDPKLIWRLHIERAQILAGMNRASQARREFEAAVRTADKARESITANEYRLTYFTQLLNIYQNYVHFLVEHKQPNDALRVAESGHARLLAEKLRNTEKRSPNFNFTSIARAKNAVILSYSIAPEHSYMWVTTSHGTTSVSSLPPETRLEELIKRHNAQILDERSIAQDEGGRELYDALIGPVAHLIPPGSNVIIIPDGPLAKLNFETLIAPGSVSHYWLESAVVTVAPSLTLLHPQEQHAIEPASILLAGNALQSDLSLPPLGPLELDYINQLYPSKCRLLTEADATPTGFLQAHPDQYSWIHLSTHAISYPQSPLDSYIVLSPEASGACKLYAHDLAKLRLKANLVTLSACQSAGKDVPGEGLVGLTWGVLGAGAQNVVASLWSVGSTSTSGLMEKFYSHLHEGQSPALALHSAKLEMVKAKANPYEWAAFQLYSL